MTQADQRELGVQVHKEVGVVRKGYWCVKEWPSEAMEQAYELAMLLFLFCCPLAVMTFTYASVCIEMTSMSAKRAQMIRSGTDR